MTTGNALDFIKRGMGDGALRKRLNAANDIQGRDEVLRAEALLFSDHDFDEAYHHQLTLFAYFWMDTNDTRTFFLKENP